jgi:hypothetical protein
MAWGSLVICGLILWGVCGGVYAMGRDVWPAEMPEAVRLVVAPAVASAVTVAHKLVAPDFGALARAAVLGLMVAALDALVLAPVVDRNYAMFRGALAEWLPLAAIVLASWVTGVFAPV